jgi:hypothetical protein
MVAVYYDLGISEVKTMPGNGIDGNLALTAIGAKARKQPPSQASSLSMACLMRQQAACGVFP